MADDAPALVGGEAGDSMVPDGLYYEHVSMLVQ